jgi:hypothetical protein
MRKLLLLLFTLYLENTYAQTYLNIEQEYPDGNNGKYSISLATLNSYSAEHIQTAFNVIANSGIYFNYPQGGYFTKPTAYATCQSLDFCPDRFIPK